MRQPYSVSKITRAELPEIRSVEVDGKEHLLGILKDFRKDPRLARFIPRQSELSMAWVHLDPGQELGVHRHPVDSMIVVCEGEVRTTGDLQGGMEAGDILIVPAGRQHGFIGAGARGFWGLSIQFESRGLYEDMTSPLVRFAEHVRAPADPGISTFEGLLERNEWHVSQFVYNPLFGLARAGKLEGPEARKKFLDRFQVWSDCFQKLVQLRAAVSDRPAYAELAHRHLVDERDHNVELSGARKDLEKVWDPLLESTCSWFLWKILTSGDPERTLLVHWVIEASATVFYREMGAIFSATEGARHAELHVDADCAHVKMGVDLLARRKDALDFEHLAEVQRQGWSMLNSMFARIHALVSGQGPVR